MSDMKHGQCARCVELAAEVAALQQTFDLQWKADMRAVKRWREAHPGNDLVLPDRANMVVWLMEQHDAPAQCALEPAAWQWRVNYDKGSARENEWCSWHDTTEKYYNSICAEIANGRDRVEVRVLYALSSTERG